MDSKRESTEDLIFMPLESIGALGLISMGSRLIHQLGSMIAPADS